jgi:polar amino acid transport system substrate-binding protein
MKIHMNLIKVILSIGLILGLLGVKTSHADDLDMVLAAKKIRVGIDFSTPPYGMLDEKLQQTGTDIEYARLLAADLGVNLEVVQLTGANRVPFLQTNKVDVVIASFSITAERMKVISFSKPYSVIASAIGAPERVKISSLADLAGKKIGVTRGTVNDGIITSKAPPGTQIMRFEDDSASATAMLTGQIDAYATALPVYLALNKRDPSLKMRTAVALEYFRLGVGVRQADTKLHERLNVWVDTNLQNGKIPAIYQKYLGEPLPIEQLK